MSVTFFAENVLESTDVTVTVCNASTGAPATRLYDRVRGLQFGASSSGTLVNVDATGTVHHPVGSVALVNHNATTTAIFYGSPDAVAWTSVATFNPAGVDPYHSTFAAFSTAYLAWRVAFPANVTRLQIGELLLGCAAVVATNPTLGKLTDGSRGNRRDDESPAGFVWSVRRGAPRAVADMAWNAMTCDDWTALSSAFAQSNEGAKPLLVTDYLGTRRWMRFASADLRALRVTTPLRAVVTSLEEVL